MFATSLLPRTQLRRASQTTLLGLILVGVCGFAFSPLVANAQRSNGLDLSAWQGNLSQRVWNRLHVNDDIDFAFIRSSRGGTTGFYNQSDPNNNGGQNTFSQRYDDPYFVQNITRATQAGILTGSYHFSRPDISTNTGADEADHFIEMAGAWMRPGYLLPVHDLEAGDGTRSDNQLAQFTLDFTDRIHEVMGIRPAIYVNGNYAHFVIGQASTSLRTEVVEKHPVMWMARPENGADVQNEDPSDYLSWTYGAWDDPPNPTHPWSFWQHSWTGDLSSYNGDLDLNVAQGGMEFLKDHLVPALWTTSGGGDWSTLANWNSGQVPIAPVQGSGQVPRVGSLTLPDVRLPGADDTVILDRPNDGGIVVSLTTGDHEIRKLVARETLEITGGSLTMNYVPHPESTPYSAQFSAPVGLSGGALSAHTIQVDAAQTFNFEGGVLAINELQLMPHATSPAKIDLHGNVVIQSLSDDPASIVTGIGSGNSGLLDLGGLNRRLEVPDGLSAIDLQIEVPITNGGVTKAGLGALELGGANTYVGETIVEEGMLSLGSSFLSDSADVHVAASALLDLDFVGIDAIDSLFFDGISQSVGTWGAVGSGAQFTSPLLTGTGLLQVATFDAPLPGDFDGNGMVDNADMAQWLADLGLNADSDADGDGDSDGTDFLAWQANYGAGTNPLAASQSVPEPSAATMLIGAALACCCRRRLPV